MVNIGHIDKDFKPSGHALLLHPDLLWGTTLGKGMDNYTFFSYKSHEALHVSNVELFLKYCTRFFNRQCITRDRVNMGIIDKFDASLIAYIQRGETRDMGTPSVPYFAEEQHLSPNYFGDLIKKETGTSAQEYIQSKIIAVAKDKILDPDKSISEIAYELGFKYPQHFSRLFKQQVGYSPSEYRSLN